MTGRARRRTLLACALAACVPALGLAACGEERRVPGPPAAIHGAVVIEPAALHVGDVVAVEITVVTPPDHRLRPVRLPESIPPLWVLDAERLPLRREGERWTHVTRVRTRVREAPGSYTWPAQTLEVEDASGEVTALVLEARPFTVASVSDEIPDRLEPFGLRAPAASGEGGFLFPAIVGSLATLLALGGLGMLRRRRERAAAAADAEPLGDTPAWTAADDELSAALARLDDDARAAADDAAISLRRYVHRRTRRPVETLTTEEIAAQRPPGRLRSRWPELVALLQQLDALRFPGGLDREEGRAALREALEDARRFVADSIPPREMR